jgi:hypothetical protein
MNAPASPAQDIASRLREVRCFADFYPLYLKEHSDSRCRRMHFAGSTLALACLGLLAVTGSAVWLAVGLGAGYACAWIGHFVFEKNRPASFSRPLYSFMGDWAMYRDMWRGRVPF